MRYYIRQRFFSWTDSFDITDEEGYAVYSVRADLLALSHVLRVFDDQDQEVGLVREKLFHFLPTFEVELDGDLVAVIRKEFSFLHPATALTAKGGVLKETCLAGIIKYTVTASCAEPSARRSLP